MSKNINLNILKHQLNNMIDLFEHKTTGKSLYAIRRERTKNKTIVNNNKI
jgi:hypothetical protein